MLPINVTVLLLACSVLGKKFDYIVVGGGTTGHPLAVRLAEYWNVALVEAGGRYEKRYPLAKTPGADVLPVGSDPETSSPIDWGFVTEPFPGANGRSLHIAQGKCLRGS
jgi:choline dehydrogenase-like flavoprotein